MSVVRAIRIPQTHCRPAHWWKWSVSAIAAQDLSKQTKTLIGKRIVFQWESDEEDAEPYTGIPSISDHTSLGSIEGTDIMLQVSPYAVGTLLLYMCLWDTTDPSYKQQEQLLLILAEHLYLPEETHQLTLHNPMQESKE